MSIIRRETTRNFTIIKNEIVNNKALTMEAMGLLTFMLSKPNGWEFRQDHLCNHFNVGRDRMRSVMKTLSDAGYVRREKENDPVTGYIKTTTIVSDDPVFDREADKPEVGEPKSENPSVGEPTPIVITDCSKTDLSKTVGNKTAAAKKSPPVDLPDWMPLESWENFIGMRKDIKKPVTERSAKMLIKKLTALKEEGQNVAEVLDQSTRSSWSDVYPVKQGKQSPQAKTQNIFDSLNSYAERRGIKL